MDTRLESGRLAREWRTKQVMVGIYCRGHDHAGGDEAEGHRFGQLDEETVWAGVSDDGSETGFVFLGRLAFEKFEDLDFD